MYSWIAQKRSLGFLVKNASDTHTNSKRQKNSAARPASAPLGPLVGGNVKIGTSSKIEFRVQSLFEPTNSKLTL
jgi:hypothetical protein